jgi:hypothetical protein
MDGNTYKVIINKTEKGSPSFTIIYPNLKKSSRKGDLAAIFQYEDLTADSFLALGLTEPGRRKQAEYFMRLMSPEVQNEIHDLDQQVNTKNGTLYVRRAELKTNLKYLEMNSVAKPSDEQYFMADNYDQWVTDLESQRANIETSLSDFYNATSETKLEKERVEILQDKVRDTKIDIEAAELRLSALKQNLLDYEDTLNNRPDVNAPKHTEEDIMKMTEELNASTEAVASAKEAVSAIKVYNDSSSQKDALSDQLKTAEDTLELKRKAKAEIIKINLKMKHIKIEDGIPLFIDESGAFPINEENISYSKGVMIVLDLVLKINKNYPICFVGKANELDKNSKNMLLKYAKATDSIIVLDKVEESGTLAIEVYEEN